MISAFANCMKVPDLRSRILFTLAIIVIIRLGVYIPLPGVDVEAVTSWLQTEQQRGVDPLGGVGTFLNIFSGGGIQQMGIFALGIMPYISASIMTQLLGAVIPAWSKMMQEEGGRQKATLYTRIIAIVIATVQGYFLTETLRNPSAIGLSGLGDIVMYPGAFFSISTIFIIVTATMLLMWIGDQITERGVGNGVSLIISVNIIYGLPGALSIAWKSFIMKGGEFNPLGALSMVSLILFMVIVIALIITVVQAQRRIPVQYAKRVVGHNKMAQGGTQYLPLKLNYSGVMPVIFATAILSLPYMLVRHLFADNAWVMTTVDILLSQYNIWYYVISAILIFFFSYFWVATMFRPQQIAEDIKRSGGYIPGVRPGAPTALYLDQTMTRLTTAGSLFLALIFFIPSLLLVVANIDQFVGQFFGGTSLLILVGVLLDIMRQIETTLLQKHYDGFMKKGKIRGKYSHLQGTGEAAKSRTVVLLWIGIAIVIMIGAIIAAS